MLLESTPDLSADAFPRSFRRLFISRRGIPKHVRSDNAKNFMSAMRLSRLLDIAFNLLDRLGEAGSLRD